MDSWVVLTSCFFPDRRPIKFLEVSAAIQGAFPLRTYGEGKQYENWTRMKVHMMIPELMKLKAEGFTHYLYTDGRDAFFTKPWSNTKEIYELMGSPDGLLSAQPDCFTQPELATHWDHLLPAKYRFHCCGGYMGLIDYWLETHQRFVRDNYEARPTGGDEAGVWQWAWVDGWFRPAIDTGCHIFQNLGGSGSDVELLGSILYNKHTKSCPTILHFTGFCKDQVYGVYDDMKPWWDKIYPNCPISKGEIAA